MKSITNARSRLAVTDYRRLLVNNQLKVNLGVFFFYRYLANLKEALANLVISVKWKVVLPIRTD
jgi:hypothetical protein